MSLFFTNLSDCSFTLSVLALFLLMSSDFSREGLFINEVPKMSQVFAALPILSLFVLGYLLKKVSFFKDSTIVDIKKLVTNISLPALLFNAFLSLDIQAKDILIVAVIYLMCTLMLVLGRIIAKIGNIKSPYFPLMMGGFEMGMFGYALFISLYGAENLGKIAFLTIGQSIFVFTILISGIMATQNGKH